MQEDGCKFKFSLGYMLKIVSKSDSWGLEL